MISSSYLADHSILVFDASVVINLNATNRAKEIISALPNDVVVTDNAMEELSSMAKNGHADVKQLKELVASGYIQLVALDTRAIDIYLSLIDGGARQTLDDGEAAMIAYAHRVGGVPIVDEPKVARLCRENFPHLKVCSTVDLLLDKLVIEALGRNEQRKAIYRALTVARMRVPQERLPLVLNMIAEGKPVTC